MVNDPSSTVWSAFQSLGRAMVVSAGSGFALTNACLMAMRAS
jgi:hypothetical protein